MIKTVTAVVCIYRGMLGVLGLLLCVHLVFGAGKQDAREWVEDQITLLDVDEAEGVLLALTISGFADKVEIIAAYRCIDLSQVKTSSVLVSEVIPEHDSTLSGKIDSANQEIVITLKSGSVIRLGYSIEKH